LHLFNSKDGTIYSKEDLLSMDDFMLRQAVEKELSLLKKKKEELKKKSKGR
jgi:hypothetical protein